jgi:uncharacterized protein
VNVAYPYQVDNRGRTAEADTEEHVRQLIEQVLFTSPGERVNRPTFGCGLMQLIFAPNSGELAAAVQLMTQGALQQWLGELIQVEAVEAASEDSTLRVTVQYVLRRGQQRRVVQLTREV